MHYYIDINIQLFSVPLLMAAGSCRKSSMSLRTIRPSSANSTMRIYIVRTASDVSSCIQSRSPRRRFLTMSPTLTSSGSTLSWLRAKLIGTKSLLAQMHKSLSNRSRGTQDLPLKTYSGKGSVCLSSPI